MTDRKFNEHNTFDKALVLMTVGDKTTQDAIHESYNDYSNKGIITFDQWHEKINELWSANFAKVMWYDIKEFIDKVLYREDVPERCEEFPIRISVGNRYLEIPMNPVTQGALELALEQFSTRVFEELEKYN